MANQIKFHKMHGAGNDYIYVNTMIYPISNPENFAIRWSKFHTGIGSDGLVLIGASNKADFSMRIFNADGSEALMCGNASRCIGKYVYDLGLTSKKEIALETLSGIKRLNLHVVNNKVETVSVDMGEPETREKLTEIEIDGMKIKGTIVSMGNPHFVIFTEDAHSVNLPTIGPLIEHHPVFPDRTNVEFAQTLSRNEIRMRVWERGSGITQACGTGACATLVAGVQTGKTDRKASVEMDGGILIIEWDETTNKVWMTGEAVMVYEGFLELTMEN
ncbi:MAG: diaminopimelate epimerase [Tannerella sp.]|nr:diaminopimelate epimerase [Tannerella sp.]